MLTRFESQLSEDYFYDRIKDKKILVLGSGPSFDARKWQDLDFDAILTVSFWYNRKELLQRDDIIYTLYSNLVDCNNPQLNEYLDTHDTVVAFEENSHPFYRGSGFKNFKSKYASKYVNVWTRDHSNALHVGTAGRTMFFAMNFEPAVMYYVGFDGTSPQPADDPNNAFRQHLRPEPKASGGVGSQNRLEIVKGHMNLAKIIHTKSQETGTKIYNLGEGLPYNITTTYSQEHYPLTDEIKQIII